MITRQRLVTYGIPTLAAATIITAALLKPRRVVDATPPYEVNPTPAAAGTKRIDVVFAIDTTESMSGLIDGAKRTVWGIAGHIRDTNPQADIHVGLVAYRDVGDDYVTRDFQLTSDLDAMFAELSTYRAAGGDDIPEDVAAGLYDAVYKMQWRDGAKKIIFLVGDAPPASRGDVPRYDVIAREAASRDIIINTIRCGTDVPGTLEAWQEIAALGHGEFSTIAADGGVHQVATEYDAKMAEISGRIDSNAVILGADKRAAYEGKMAAAKAAPVEAQAERGAYYGAMGSAASRDDGDAVSAVATGRVTVDGLAADALPPELQHLSKDELKAEMTRRADERKALTKELQDLKAKRAEALKGKGGAGFDAKVKETIDRQLQ
jgi:hypothetical protein